MDQDPILKCIAFIRNVVNVVFGFVFYVFRCTVARLLPIQNPFLSPCPFPFSLEALFFPLCLLLKGTVEVQEEVMAEEEEDLVEGMVEDMEEEDSVEGMVEDMEEEDSVEDMGEDSVEGMGED